MATKSVAKEAEEILLATEMIRLGARLQVLQAETNLSYDRLARLYREIKGCSPPKGMLPFSVDWFMTWLPNIHSSLFYSVYKYMDTYTPAKKAHALVEAYRMYLEQASAGRPDGADDEPVLSFTRAWMLVRFFDSNMLQLSTCTRCKGGFVAHAHDPQGDFVCAICRPPPRAGKTRARKSSPDDDAAIIPQAASKAVGPRAAGQRAARPSGTLSG
ncbi:flagellar transcriptional regulator FlhC [Parapusillimonas granuli]|uniref:Flagellar transcriptional regulator FlhC n=1 Tax=Parapusillimonas granuli TaxID=380911 RepID=A0A853FR05_9BURK|nr:flagellar transcriptional regulator FlhC [Parapusillimonas granuli]MBB5213415.1 flagellar transcriptional activator FlhC [Parapusillimonas granuli]NYT48254.1 flagellar transcriptional regulator FlhC [Parapusillimonas granuli]